MCLYPKLIQNRKYIANKKNGGNIPAVLDNRVLYVPVGCGECMECKKQKSRDWQVRLLEDIRHNKNGIFVTLTLSNESIRELGKDIILEGYDRDNEIAKIATRRFLERWRKKHKKSVFTFHMEDGRKLVRGDSESNRKEMEDFFLQYPQNGCKWIEFHK